MRMYHKVQGFFSSLPNWDFPTPAPAGDCVPPFGSGWRTHMHSHAGEEVGGPISDEGQTLWYSRYRYICILWMYYIVLGKTGPPTLFSVDSAAGFDLYLSRRGR